MVAKPLCPLYKNIIKPLDRVRYPELRYAYCIFALFSLAFSVCRQAGLSFRTSPILIPLSPILVTIKQLVLQLAPIALWGIFRYTLPAGVKLLRRCSELMVLYYVLSFILGQCFKFNFVTMMQDGQITPRQRFSPGYKALWY